MNSENSPNTDPQIISIAKKMAKDKKEMEALIAKGVTPEELLARGYQFKDAIKL